MVRCKMGYALSVSALVLGAGALVPMGAWATGEEISGAPVAANCFTLGETSYATFSEARNAANSGDTIVLSCNVEQDKYYGITKDLTFDLNGHTYRGTKNLDGSGAFQVANGNKFTVVDSVGGGKISGIHYGVIVLSGGEFTLQSGEVSSESTADVAVYNSEGTVKIYGGKVTTPNGTETSSASVSVTDGSVLVNGGEITGAMYGIVVWHDAELTVNGGTITADTYYAITGNGTIDPTKDNYGGNTTIAINGGSIRANKTTAIYHPQKDGIMTISGNTEIYGKKTGIEVRAGTVGISSGSITVDGTTAYNYEANGNGTTTDGVAVAVAQHTTKLPITVNITGGTFTAPVAFSEINPQGNSAEDLAKISLSITNGNFIDNDGMGYVVHSEDVTGFISGGEFTKEVNTAYIAENYDEYDVGPDGPYYVAAATEVNLPEQIYLQVGDSYNLNLPEIATTYGTLGGAADVATIESGVITATAVGTGVVNFNLYNYVTPVDTSIGVVVYNVAPEPNDDAEAEDRDTVADYAAGLISQIIAGEQVENMELSITVDQLKDYLANGYTIETAVNYGDYISEDEYVTTEGYAEIAGAITEENEGLLALIRGEVAVNLVKDGADTVNAGMINELPEAITLTATLEDEMLVPGEGYDARDFYVLRYHGGEVEKIRGANIVIDGSELSFENDRFSTFGIAYVDTVSTTETESTIGDTGSSTTTSPESGTMTQEGASAMSAGVMTIGAVAVITSIVGLAAIMRRK